MLGDKALAVFSRFFALLGIQLKPGKSSAGNKIIFLELLGEFPCAQNRFQLAISLTMEKRAKWACLIASYLKRGQLSHRCRDKLIGRLLFSQTSLFGEFARTQLRPLYTKLHRRVYNAQLSSLERSNHTWRLHIIAEFTPRIAVPRPRRADWLIYTDAATEPATLCGLLFRGDSTTPSLGACCSQRTAVTWEYMFRYTALIYGIELLALVAFFEDHAPLFRGICCWVYLDNNNCLEALTRGDPNTDVIAVLVARFWRTVQRFDICVWFSRVRSKINPSDLPTRANRLPFAAKRSLRFRSPKSLFSHSRSQLHLIAPSTTRVKTLKKHSTRHLSCQLR